MAGPICVNAAWLAPHACSSPQSATQRLRSPSGLPRRKRKAFLDTRPRLQRKQGEVQSLQATDLDSCLAKMEAERELLRVSGGYLLERKVRAGVRGWGARRQCSQGAWHATEQAASCKHDELTLPFALPHMHIPRPAVL